MEPAQHSKRQIVFAIEWTNVLFPHTWLEDIMQTKKMWREQEGTMREKSVLHIHDFSEPEFLAIDGAGDEDCRRLSPEETHLYRTCQEEVKKTISMCLELGQVRVITSLRGGAELHEAYACKVEDEFFEQWTGLQCTDAVLGIMPENGSQRKFQEKEFVNLIKEGVVPNHFVSIGSDINYRNATFACKTRPAQTIFHAVSMRDHQYDLGYQTLGFYRDRSVVSCASLIDQHRTLRTHLSSIVNSSGGATKGEDYHLDLKKGISLFFQKDLKKLEEYLKLFGKNCPDDLSAVSYGKGNADFLLPCEGKIEIINMNFISSRIDDTMKERSTAARAQPSYPALRSDTTSRASQQETGEDHDVKKKVSIAPANASAQPSFLFKTGYTSSAPQKHAMAVDETTEGPIAAEARRSQMKEARLRRLSQTEP